MTLGIASAQPFRGVMGGGVRSGESARPCQFHWSVRHVMSEKQMHPSIAQRVIIKFLAREGVKPAEILRRLTVQFGNQTLSRPRVFAWHKKFMVGRKGVENKSHDRRPRTSITKQNITAIRDLLESDRRLIVPEICSEIGISYGSTQSIIIKDLGFHKVSARWVPRLLTAEQKLNE